MRGWVGAVCAGARHGLGKDIEACISLREGLGVEGDAHFGATVQHRSRVARDPSQPNLRQVHLIHGELLDELRASGFPVAAGQLGENITTRGIDLLALPLGTQLRVGSAAVVELTGLRNPCHQLDGLHKGLRAALKYRDEAGRLVRKCGVMGVVLSAGEVHPGDGIRVQLPAGPHHALEPV